MTIKLALYGLSSLVTIADVSGAHAQQVDPSTVDAGSAVQASEDALGLGDIVVTATRRGQTRLDTSVSVSSLDAEAALQNAPRSTAELLRSIPGVRSESSGGEGNANIAVRGLPISAGGAKFLQLWEDGLPVLEYGDIAFGNADIFLRADYNVATIESIRGGSASTLASNSPGGVINFISKTGAKTGGALAFTKGLDFGTNRFDGDYGHNFGDGWTAHVGGFYRWGEGARRTGYTAEKGGQIRGNITKTFDGGYVRANFKYLNDRAISYLPMPLQVTGSNSDPDYASIPGFDIKRDTPHSAFTRDIASLTTGNRRAEDDLAEGMHPVVKQIGLEGSYEFSPGWVVENRFKIADVGGEFISPFPSSVIGAQAAANQVGANINTGSLTPTGTSYSLRYATGPNAGQVVNPAALNGNGLAMQTNIFNTKLDTLDNWMNNLRLSKTFDVGSGSISASAGYYHSYQEVGTTWTWASYLQDVRGDGKSAFLDVFDPAGNKLTQSGQWAYGVPTFGNCCIRTSYTETQTNAFFGSVVADFQPLNIDLSVRRDQGSTTGYFISGTVQQNLDVDSSGTISPIERHVTAFDAATRRVIDFDYGYWSYSAGLNYLVTPDVALFARYSKGARANNDRLLIDRILPDGSARPGDIVNPVKQAEGGVKYRANNFGLFATGFYARTSELLTDDRAGRFITNRVYESKGIELEGSYRTGGFSINATGTLTDAKIKRDDVAPALNGNRPQRQATFLYAVTPRYTYDRFTVGANVVGTTESFSTNTNGLVMPGYTVVNGFIEARVLPALSLSVNANNLFNTFGLTEEEEGSITSGVTNFVRARAINGRTISATARLNF
jgi:outer membrane receptor protein involved in Fe transport